MIDDKLNTDLLEPEFLHFLQVLESGAKKYGKYSWLERDGPKTNHKDMHASMFRHLAESSAGKRADDESGLDPLLHLASRALMMYTRIQRGIGENADPLITVEVLPNGDQVLVSRQKSKV